MSVSELEKSSLLSEIEENLSNTISFKYKSVQEDVMQLYADRDNLISQDSIQLAVSHGVDPRQMVTLPLVKDKSFFRSMDTVGASEELKLDNQFEFFVSTFETLELVDLIYHTTEEESSESFVSAKDRLLNLKLPRVSFNPLFDSIKDSNSVLFRTLAQLPIISGQGKSRKKTPTKKEKKHKDRSKSDHSSFLMDRSSGAAGSDRLFGKLKGSKNKKDTKGDSATSGTPLGFDHSLTWSEDTLLEPKKYKEVLALIVAKNIADNTLSSYLATVALLLSVSRDDRYASELSLNSQHSLLPVGSTIATLFDSGTDESETDHDHDDDLEEVSDDNEEDDDEEDEHDDDMDEEGDSRLLGHHHPHGGGSGTGSGGPQHPENMSLNPFRNYVIASRRSRTKSMTNSDVSRYDESLSLDRDRSSSKDEINSSCGVYHHNPHRSVSTASAGPYSDAGSTIGSTIGSTFAEIGTETASMQGDDLSEEELLAQALALSMGAEHLLMTSSTPTQHLQAESGSATAAADTSLASYDVRSSDHNLDIGGMQSMYGEASMTGLNVVFDRQAPHTVPEDLPAVDPLSTFGPFSCSQFWSRVVTPSSTKAHTTAAAATTAAGGVLGGASSAAPEENNTIMGNLVTLRHVILSLLVVVSHSADQVLGTNQADEKDSEGGVIGSSRTKTGKAYSKKSSGKATDPSDSVGSSDVPHYIRGVATSLPVAPNPILIHLIEHLMDLLIQELRRHCAAVNQPVKTNTNYSNKPAGDRLSFSSGDGRMQLDDEDFHRGAGSPTGDGDAEGYEAVMRRKEQLVRDRLLQEENQESEWYFHQYFLVFSINVLMKLFRATMQVVVGNGMSVLAIGLGAIDRYDFGGEDGSAASAGGSATSADNRPLLQRLLRHFSDCMGAENLLIRNNVSGSPIQDSSSVAAASSSAVGALHDALTNAIRLDRKTVDVFTTLSNSILVASPSSDNTAKQVALGYSSINFRHQLRLIAANSYVATLTAYHNTVHKRYTFLERLLKSVPTLSDSLVGHYFEDSSLLQLLNIEHYERNFDLFLHNTSAEFSKEPPLSFYQLYLLQKVANAVLTLDDHTAGLTSSPSFPKTNKLARKAAASGSGSSGTTSSLTSSGKERLSLDTVMKKSDSEVKEEAQLSVVLQNILNLLMSRLKDPYLVHGVQKHRHYAPHKGLYSGELNLLRALQFRVMVNYSVSIYDRTHINQSSFDFCFNPRRSHPNMNITEDSRVVIHNGPKVWATASSALALEPNSGTYEWQIKVDRCAKGHAFIGIVTAECPVERDNYVGVDRHSYGCIGTKSLWHNKSKIVTEYGQGFASGSVIGCRLDTNKGTLSFTSVDSGSDWGVAFENIPKVAIYPAVSLHERDDQMTLLRCIKVVAGGGAGSSTSNAPSSLSLPVSHSTGSIDVLSDAVCSLSEADFNAERDMIQYMKYLHASISGMLNLTDKILSSGSSGAVEDVEVILSHPMIGVLLPSLMASFASSSYEMHNTLHMSVLHLLPLFLTLTKRLSGAFDSLSGYKKQSSQGSAEKTPSDFVHGFTGSWQLISSAISSANIQAQEYLLTFSDPIGEGGKSSEKVGEPAPSCSSVHTPVLKLSAVGSTAVNGLTSTVKCHGTQYGTRVKFLEVWTTRETTSYCLIEGRVSLCGLYFSGRYKDMKSSKMGSITGTRVGGSAELVKNDEFYVRSTVYRAVLLGMMALSKFSCHMMISNISRAPSSLAKAVTAGGAGASHDVSPMTMEVDPGDLSPVPGTNNQAEEGAAASEVDMSAAEHALSTQCVNTDLFSGGFNLRHAHLTEYLVNHIVSHVRPTVLNPSSSSSSVDIAASQELLWWVANAVPDLKHQVIGKLTNSAVPLNAETSSPHSMLTIEQLAERDFYAEMISEDTPSSAVCNMLDATISRHAGQSALIKIGGEVVQKARKIVLAAAIKHTGCYPLCMHEHRLIKEKAAVEDLSNDLDGKYRPNTVLLDVWQAVQRIMERAVRAKLESSSTYASVCDVLCHKAHFLLEVEVNRQVLANSESITLVLSDQSSAVPKAVSVSLTGEPQSVKDMWSTPDSPGHNVAQEVSKCISNVVEFLTNTVRNTSAMRELMYHRAFAAVLRSAGMKSLLMLLNKTSSDGLSVGTPLPAVSNLTLQCCPFTYLLQALRDINAAVNNRSLLEVATNASASAHYLDGLWGVSESLLNTCRSSMEAMYDVVTKYLSRSSWAGSCFRDGQIVALSSWLVAVKPEDHSFLSKISIFRVLQGVLEDARTSIASMYEKYPFETFFNRSGDNYEVDLLNRFKDHGEGVFACDILLNSHKKLATLVLTVVHGLAVQVASVKESAKAITSGPSRLQRNQSGPDTLSKSLFDLMYIELFSTLRGVLIAANTARTSGSKALEVSSITPTSSTPSLSTTRLSLSMLGRRIDSPTVGTVSVGGAASSSASSSAETNPEECLEGEVYAYRILRLLFLVSSSKLCQKLLSSPKWISLFVSCIGFGGISIQRRVMTLLRRLLMNSDPAAVVGYIPSLFDFRDEIVSSETPLDDDDFKLLIDETSGKSTAKRLIQFLLEGVSSIYPHTPASTASVAESSSAGVSQSVIKDRMRASFIALSIERNMLDSLSADSLVILRVLYGIPAWRRVISEEVVANMSQTIQSIADAQNSEGTVASVEYDSEVYLGRIQQLYKLSAALSVVGGYTERLRMGGQVTLKPFCLLGSSADVYATKIAAATYSSAMLISSSTSTASVEVVLMEKGIKITCTDAKPDAGDTKGDLKVMIQHTTLLASSIPIKTIRLSVTDVQPSPDIAVISSLIQGGIVAQLIDAVSLLTVPWMKAVMSPSLPVVGASPNSPAGSQSFINVMKIISNVFSIKSLSIALQNEMSVELFLAYKTNVFKELLLLAIMPTQFGNLNVLECLEERFSKLWVAHCKPEPKPEPKQETEPTPSKSNSGSATKSLIRETMTTRERLTDRQRELDRERESRMEAAQSASLHSARDLAGILSSYGAARASQIDPATKAAALAQMLEIGLQQDFCEFALRRCHYDVEMAINMCLEHGSDMSMLIAEEAMFNAANASREASAASVASARRSTFLSREPSMASSGFSSGIPALDSRIHLLEQRIAAAAGMADGGSHVDGTAVPPVYMRIGRSTEGGASVSSAQARGYRPSSREVGDSEREAEGSLLGSRMLLPPLGRSNSSTATDPQSLIRQLLAMGFPPAWCARAIASNNGDLEGALGYILTHDAELTAATNETMGEARSARLGRIMRARREELTQSQQTLHQQQQQQQSSAMDMDPDEEFFNDTDMSFPSGDNDAENADQSEDDADSEPAFRPIVNVSGNCDIKPDLTCIVTSGGFPSVGCRYYPVSSGKWYYELTVLTSGCIQVGWVDSAYEGGADAGQGVGDDLHSWAYDGWRTYLWHETSAEWGTRWSSGDVVGCAVDCDNHTMSFYLNGFGVEVSMGEAFRNIEFHGGVYPCASFNRNEKIKFCFGGPLTPFKHSPPPGYKAFSENIVEQRERNREMLKVLNPGQRSSNVSTASAAAVAAGLLRVSPSTDFDFLISSSGVIGACSSSDELELEDSFESSVGDKAFPWHRRYFAADDASSSNTTHALTSETFNYFSNTAGYLPRQPSEKADIVSQMETVGKDLCILYCRLSILRTLNKLSSMNEGNDMTRKNQLIEKVLNTTHVTADSENERQVVVESILTLIRIASAHTSRTKAYISAMSMFSTSFSTPSNFGSIYCTGGYPLLLQLRDTFTSLVSHGRTANVANFVDAMIGEIFNTTRGAIRRDHAGSWKLESNFAPIGGGNSDSSVSNVPSLSLAVWMTSILMELFIKELNLDTASGPTSIAPSAVVDHSTLSGWISKLMRVWMFALRSPAVTVKICAMRIITYILQEFMTSHDSRTVTMLNSIVAELFTQSNSLQRYEEHTIYKLNVERVNLPVCSEYLQALLEFTTSIKNIFHLHVLQNTVAEQQQLETESCLMRMDSGDLSPSVAMMDVASVPSTPTTTLHCPKVSEYSPFSEHECENNDPSFNWESVNGRVFSDAEGDTPSEWTTYTGSVKILKISDWPTTLQRFTMSERQELPPELMIGCKVLRQAVKPPRMSGSKRPRGESDSPKDGSSPGGNAGTTSSGNNAGTASTSAGLSLSTPVPSALQELMEELNPREEAAVPPSRLSRESSSFSPMDRIKRIFDRSPLSQEKSESKDKSRNIGSSASDNNSSSDEKSHQTDDDEMVDQIGTVVSITAWPNDVPGSAREVLWDDGERETVRWGAGNGCFDVTHVAMKGNKVATRYPHPQTYITKLATSGFGSEQTFGIVLRLRHIPNDQSTPHDGIQCQVVGILEYGDFNATILCNGVLYTDGTYALTEQRLLCGPSHSGWESRFGTTYYQSGTSYSISVSHSSSKDITDPSQNVLSGEYQFRATFPIKSYDMLGDVRLQRKHLFVFDDKVKANNINCSSDRLSCSKVSGGSQGVVFGNVGFSSGVHYWEFKVEQADLGSIFIGVSEKPADIRGARLSRWMGAGFASNRAAFRTAQPGGGGDRVAVYGDHFHTGDSVGVVLDLNRGKLSFVLDGLKYGEHSICDLGEAFDNMTAPTLQKPRTYFPIVGLSKNLDRVTLTPRWLSNVGMSVPDEYKLYNKAWLLLSSWSIERPMNKPFSEHMWIYREGWRNWLSWLSAKTIRIRTRCKAAALVVNITPRACVTASMKLGLQTALFSGDRVIFTKTSGRALDIKEEAVILGVFNGMLWYRLDAQTQNGGALMESNTLAWALVPNDVEGMSLLRRRPVENSKLSLSVTELPLPRLPAFQGGLIHLFHDTGAVVRRGLEIDTSEVVCEIPGNTTVYAIEKRMNASNIDRYRVLHEGHYGWISEKMRGGAEEVMLNRVTSASAEEKRAALIKLVEQAEVAGITDKIVFQDVSSLKEGLAAWEQSVRDVGAGDLLSLGGALSSEPGEGAFRDKSFEYFLSLSSTIDGVKQWSVEADMQLVELISNCAAREGVTPHNLSTSSLEKAIAAVKPSSKNNCLIGVDTTRAVARSAILRVANLIFGNALPYINLMLPEEKLKNDVIGSDCDIELLPTTIPPCTVSKGDSSPTSEVPAAAAATESVPATLTIADSMKYKDYITFDEINKSRNPLGSWVPLCCARRMRSLRRLLFNQTKQQFFDAILEVTTTSTPLHQDEYEDPREIKSLRINRVKATASKLSAIAVPSERLKQSVFGQLHRELRQWPSSAYRRSYIGKGHGNQKRAFKVKFIGEGVNDYGGPYRAVFEQVIDELQCDSVLAGGRKASERCLLPLLVPCPNRFTGVGINQDKFVLTTAPALQPINQELMNFFGKIVGTAVRHHLNLALDLSSLFWRPLVMLPVARGHLSTVDTLIVNNLTDVVKVGLRIEEEWKSAGAVFNGNHQPEEWVDMTFTSFLPDGSRVNLIAGGHDIPVNMSNWREYVSMTEQLRLKESISMYKIFRDGLSNVLPVEIFPLFTAGELQQVISGSSEVDIQLIQQCTEYEDIDPSSALVTHFWEVLQEMTSEEKTLFLRFVWARSRMPASAKDLPVNFKLQGQQPKGRNESADDYLPHAQTCFFSLSLPSYSSKEILRTKLLYAINNSPNMDADVRLHSAEGWADS